MFPGCRERNALVIPGSQGSLLERKEGANRPTWLPTLTLPRDFGQFVSQFYVMVSVFKKGTIIVLYRVVALNEIMYDPDRWLINIDSPPRS